MTQQLLLLLYCAVFHAALAPVCPLPTVVVAQCFAEAVLCLVLASQSAVGVPSTVPSPAIPKEAVVATLSWIQWQHQQHSKTNTQIQQAWQQLHDNNLACTKLSYVSMIIFHQFVFVVFMDNAFYSCLWLACLFRWLHGLTSFQTKHPHNSKSCMWIVGHNNMQHSNIGHLFGEAQESQHCHLSSSRNQYLQSPRYFVIMIDCGDNTLWETNCSDILQAHQDNHLLLKQYHGHLVFPYLCWQTGRNT